MRTKTLLLILHFRVPAENTPFTSLITRALRGFVLDDKPEQVAEHWLTEDVKEYTNKIWHIDQTAETHVSKILVYSFRVSFPECFCDKDAYINAVYCALHAVIEDAPETAKLLKTREAFNVIIDAQVAGSDS